MLTYYLNNKPFALDENTSVRISWVNPACQLGNIPGDVAMGIDIPVNETNRMLLGNPERFEKNANSSSREIPGFEIRYSGKLLISGTLVIQNASAENYSGWCRNNVGNLGKEHREKFIYDIPAFSEDITFTNKANYDPDTDPYGCPEVHNPDFFKDKGGRKTVEKLITNPDYYPGSGLDMYITQDYETELLTMGFQNYADWKVNNRNEDNTVKLGTFIFGVPNLLYELPITVVSPMLFLNFVIEKLLASAHFYINSNAIADNADLKKLVIYNNYDITRMAFATTAPIPLTGVWFDGLSEKARGIVIDYIIRDYNDVFKYRDLLPKVKLKDFILGVQNSLNVCFHFLGDGKVNIIDRETIITGAAIDINSYIVNEWEMGEKKNVALKFTFAHDKNDTFFQERWEDIDDRRLDEKEPVETLSALDMITDPIIGDVRYIISKNIYMQYALYQKIEINPVSGNEETTDMLGWTHLGGNFQNGFFNRWREDEEIIGTAFSTLPYNTAKSSPETQQPGNIKSIKFAYSNFSPRMLFYTGNNTGNYETDTLALDWEKKDKGLLATRWPKWNRFWCQRHPVTCEANLPLNMLDYVTRNITSKFRTRAGEFIIDEMETEFSLNSIGATTIRGYKSDYVPASHDLTQHWAPGNLILMDELIDFTGFDNMNF